MSGQVVSDEHGGYNVNIAYCDNNSLSRLDKAKL